MINNLLSHLVLSQSYVFAAASPSCCRFSFLVTLGTIAASVSPTSVWALNSSFTSSSSSSSSRLLSSMSSVNNNEASCQISGANINKDGPDFEIAQFPCLSDNYGFLLRCKETGETAAIDTPEAREYKRELKQRGWTLTHILNTHHHSDHAGGNVELKNMGNVQIYGPASERIPGRDVGVKGGDKVTFGKLTAQVIDVGGHTSGHIAYYFPNQKIAFVGDSLFALGCGRMFEGTPTQFWASLQRLRDLPDDTVIYCAHEYTESNAKFAVSVEPGNKDLQTRYQQIIETRKRGEPTVPTLLGLEKQTNPFLRLDLSDEIRKNVGVENGKDTDSQVFAKVRKAKDNFRG